MKMALLNEAKRNREHMLHTQALRLFDCGWNKKGIAAEIEQELHNYKGAQGHGLTALALSMA
jgi:hypothetical protein